MYEIQFLTGHKLDLQNIATPPLLINLSYLNSISFFPPIKYRESLSSTVKNVSTKHIMLLFNYIILYTYAMCINY